MIHDQPAEGGDFDDRGRALGLGQHPEEEPDQARNAPGHRWKAQQPPDAPCLLAEEERCRLQPDNADQQSQAGSGDCCVNLSL
jgi:hypothetical protein